MILEADLDRKPAFAVSAASPPGGQGWQWGDELADFGPGAGVHLK
jgi:hypothetical protein